MAVPKKRTSKTKRKSRFANWSHKAELQAKRALSLAKSVINSDSTSFVYSTASVVGDSSDED
jgi:large subunit ribosomal protein L32